MDDSNINMKHKVKYLTEITKEVRKSNMRRENSFNTMSNFTITEPGSPIFSQLDLRVNKAPKHMRTPS